MPFDAPRFVINLFDFAIQALVDLSNSIQIAIWICLMLLRSPPGSLANPNPNHRHPYLKIPFNDSPSNPLPYESMCLGTPQPSTLFPDLLGNLPHSPSLTNASDVGMREGEGGGEDGDNPVKPHMPSWAKRDVRVERDVGDSSGCDSRMGAGIKVGEGRIGSLVHTRLCSMYEGTNQLHEIFRITSREQSRTRTRIRPVILDYAQELSWGIHRKIT